MQYKYFDLMLNHFTEEKRGLSTCLQYVCIKYYIGCDVREGICTVPTVALCNYLELELDPLRGCR